MLSISIVRATSASGWPLVTFGQSMTIGPYCRQENVRRMEVAVQQLVAVRHLSSAASPIRGSPAARVAIAARCASRAPSATRSPAARRPGAVARARRPSSPGAPHRPRLAADARQQVRPVDALHDDARPPVDLRRSRTSRAPAARPSARLPSPQSRDASTPRQPAPEQPQHAPLAVREDLRLAAFGDSPQIRCRPWSSLNPPRPSSIAPPRAPAPPGVQDSAQTSQCPALPPATVPAR